MLRSLRCCLNGKVIGAAVAVGLIMWWVAPASGTAALPLLITLICPVSMGVMMWQMRRPADNVQEPGSAAVTPSGDERSEVAALREELAMERAGRQLAERKGQPRD